ELRLSGVPDVRRAHRADARAYQVRTLGFRREAPIVEEVAERDPGMTRVRADARECLLHALPFPGPRVLPMVRVGGRHARGRARRGGSRAQWVTHALGCRLGGRWIGFSVLHPALPTTRGTEARSCCPALLRPLPCILSSRKERLHEVLGLR